MTRETKVGLIVGLAFIVVFAVILSHKGGQPRASSTSDFGPIVDASPGIAPAADSRRTRQPGNSATSRTGGHPTVENRPVANAAPRPQPGTPDNKTDHLRSLSGTDTPATPSPTGDPKPIGGVAGKTRVPLPEMPNNAKDPSDRGSESLTSSLKNWLDETPKKTSDGSDHGESLAKQTRTAPPVTPPAPVEAKSPTAGPRDATPPAPAPASGELPDIKPRIKQEYTVKPGETVLKIANRFYGKSTQKEVDAILEANKKEVPKAERLRAGAKLLIPELPAGQFEAATFPPSKSRSSATEITPPSVSSPPAKDPAEEPKDLAAATDPKDTKDAKESKDTKETKGSKDAKDTKESKDGAGGNDKPDKGSNWRWYTVREGETFAAIARKHLGNAERWKEIAELNKGKFRDPLRVPAGAKIKLPSGPIAGLSKL